jgi:hypothetical protein
VIGEAAAGLSEGFIAQPPEMPFCTGSGCRMPDELPAADAVVAPSTPAL